MVISYLQKTTLIDFPGKVACIVFTPGCNFRCPFCHNPECVIPEQIQKIKSSFVDEDYFFSRLDKKKGLLDGVSICGGEPTLQPDLYNFIKKVKKKGFLVKLDTNGRDSNIVKKLLNDNLVDYVAVDAKYPIKILDQIAGVKINDDFINNYKEVLYLLKNSNIDYEYRTTVIKGYHDEHKISQIVSFLENVKNYYLQNYRGGKTLDPHFDGNSFTEEELEEFKNIAQEKIDNVGVRN